MLEIWEDIGFAADAKPFVSEANKDDPCHYVIDFQVYKIYGREGGPEGPLLYVKECDPVGIEDASVFLHGAVKWDGCSNWYFDQDDAMIHFCGVDSAENIGKLFRRLYETAAKLMPWSGDVVR